MPQGDFHVRWARPGERTFATAIREKYPDEWADTPDHTLEAIFARKYPGEYDDIPRTVPPGQTFEGLEQFQKDRARKFRPRRTVGGTLKDLLITGTSQSMGSIPGTPVGLADIATSLTGAGTPVGDLVASTPGGSIEERQRLLESFYSPVQQYESREVGEAEGVMETLKAVKRNPSVIAHTVVGAIPHMVAGAGIARGTLAGVKKFGPKAAAWFRPVAPALGEGVVSGAQTAAQIKEQMGELTPGQAALATGSGFLTGVFTRIGGRIARDMGVVDIDSVLAGVQTDRGLRRHVVNRILIGMVQEGVLEELPQSMQEQVAQNLATGQPLWTGVSQAGVLGFFTGTIVGGGTQMMIRRPTQPITPPAQLPAPSEVRKDAQQPVIEISETETAVPPPDVIPETEPEVTIETEPEVTTETIPRPITTDADVVDVWDHKGNHRQVTVIERSAEGGILAEIDGKEVLVDELGYVDQPWALRNPNDPSFNPGIGGETTTSQFAKVYARDQTTDIDENTPLKDRTDDQLRELYGRERTRNREVVAKRAAGSSIWHSAQNVFAIKKELQRRGLSIPTPEGVQAPPVTPVKPEVPVGEPVTLAAPPDAPTVPVPPIVTEPGTEARPIAGSQVRRGPTVFPERTPTPTEELEADEGAGVPPIEDVQANYGVQREGKRSRIKREAAHALEMEKAVVAAAKRIDPDVDEAVVIAELRARMDRHSEIEADVEEYGSDALLRAIQQGGGLAWGEYRNKWGIKVSDDREEIETLKQLTERGVARGIRVFNQGKTGKPIRDRTLDGMLEYLHEDDWGRFNRIEDPNDLYRAIEAALRDESPGADVLPGTRELGLDLSTRWWTVNPAVRVAATEIATAKAAQDAAYRAFASLQAVQDRVRTSEQDTEAEAFDVETIGAQSEAIAKAEKDYKEAVSMLERALAPLSNEEAAQVQAIPPPSAVSVPTADVLETGEVQPRIPEAAGVRETDISTPAVSEAPFALKGETGVKTAGEAAAQQPPLLPEDAAAKGQFRKPAPRGLDAPLVTRPAMTVETILPAEFPEILELAKRLLGDTPSVMKKIQGKDVKGVFRGRLDTPTIELLTDLFKKGNEFQLEATLAHEIGHLVDWLPQKTLARGNLLGRLQSLRKFMRREFSVHKPIAQPGSRGEEAFMLEPAGRVIQNKDILAELKAFSLKWRPWNPEKASAKTRAYRNQARELYADALSGLLIAPQELQADAPLFFQTFFDLLDAKPSVKKQYWALQEFLHKPEVDRLAARAERHEAGFAKGETKRQELFEEALERKRLELSPSQLWRRGKSELIELQTPLTDFYREHNIPVEEWLDHLNNEIQYLGGPRKAFTDEYMLPIVHAIEPTVGMKAFGRALIYQRITDGDRQNIANPYGINPENAAKQYAHLKDRLGPANTKILETELARFQEMVRNITERAYKGGILSKKLYESMKKNPAYATFSVVDHIERDIAPQIYGQKGTLREIENPAFATYQKLMKTLAWIARSDSNRKIATQLAKIDPKAMKKATVAQTTTNKFGVVRSFMPAPPGKGLIRFMEDGVTQGYYAEEYLAKAVNYQSPEFNSSILDVITLANTQVFKPLFTMINIGFMGANSVRDWWRFYKNNPTMTVRRSLTRYIQAVPMARIRAFGVPKNATPRQLEAAMGLHEAYKAGIFAESWNQHIEGQRKGDRDIDALMREVKTPEFQEPAPHDLLKPLAAVYDVLFKVGTLVETLAKAGQLYELTAKKTAAGVPFPQAVSEITPQERQHLRRDVGSPDFLGKAGWKEVTNNIWIYSYASTQGKRSDVRIALDGSYPKTMGMTSWWWKTIGGIVIPKAFIAAAMYGMFGDEPRRFYERVTEYDRKHYLPIPLWVPSVGPVTYFRMPTGDTDKIIGALVYSVLMSGKEGYSLTKTLMSIFDIGADQFPSVTPSVGIIRPLTTMVTGGNPRDPFRKRDILTQREQDARGWPAWKKFFGWGFQFLGGSTFYKFYPGERLPERRTPTQEFLELPFVSSHLGRFIRSTDYGDTERLRKVRGPERQATARGLTEEDRLIYEVVESIQGGRRVNDRRLKRMARSIAARAWPDDPRRGRERYESGTVEDRLKRAISRGMGGRWEQEYLGARSNRERAIIRRDFRESLGR